MVSVNSPGTFQGEGDPVSMGRPGSSLDDTHGYPVSMAFLGVYIYIYRDIIYIYNIYVCVYKL